MKTVKFILTSPIAALCAFAFILLLACSAASDLFSPTQEPEITSLELDKYETDQNETVTATVSATDSKGQTLRFEWAVSGGQLLQPLDRSQIRWKMPAVGGLYRITVTVSNNEKSASRSASATVRSPEKPDVKILSPSEGSHWIQHTALAVSATANHVNGIARVNLFLNGSYKATLNGRKDGQYDFTCVLEEPAGPAKVRIDAVSVTELTGSDSVAVVIDGMVLGKTKTR
jgi:hypothetical protein